MESNARHVPQSISAGNLKSRSLKPWLLVVHVRSTLGRAECSCDCNQGHHHAGRDYHDDRGHHHVQSLSGRLDLAWRFFGFSTAGFQVQGLYLVPVGWGFRIYFLAESHSFGSPPPCSAERADSGSSPRPHRKSWAGSGLELI